MALPLKEMTLVEQRYCLKCFWMDLMTPTLDSFNGVGKNSTSIISACCPYCRSDMDSNVYFTNDIIREVERGIKQNDWRLLNTHLLPTERSEILEENKIKLQVEFLL